MSDPVAMGETRSSPSASHDRFADLLTGEEQNLDPRFIPAERIAWWMTTAVISIGGLVGVMIAIVVSWPPDWWLIPAALGWMVVTGLLCIGSVRWPEVVYQRTRYLISPLGLEIRRGVLWREVVSIPQSRVQHTDVGQGPLQRKYGIATLTVHTAGTKEAAVQLSGLAYDTALRIRDFLIQSIADDAV